MEKVFLNNLGILFTAREIVLNSFKSNLFPTRNLDEILTQVPVTEPEVATKPTKVQNNNNFETKLKTKKKNINQQLFRDYFLYQTPSYLTRVLYDSNEIENDEIIKIFTIN